MDKFVRGLLVLTAILGIALILSGYKENFELQPGKYPSAFTKALLQNIYNVKSKPGLSDRTSQSQYLLDPNEFAGGYEQATNNKKYWDSPCDGTAFPPTICGGLYEKGREDEGEKVCNPGFNCRRVGFYCSNID